MNMADDLTKALGKFHLTKDEDTVIGDNSSHEEEKVTEARIKLMMVGKLLTNRLYNVEAMKNTLKSIWRLKEDVAIRMVEANLFIFQFFSRSDKEKIAQGMPWFFDNQLLLLKEVNGDTQISEVQFSQSPCWIRLYDLPLAKRNIQFVKYIDDCLGGFIAYDDADPLGFENFMRIKILVDIDKPLRRGVKIATNNNNVKWVDMKYERLGDFCYYCGCLGHVDRDCTVFVCEELEKKEMVYKYGPWLRASPLKRNRLAKEE